METRTSNINPQITSEIVLAKLSSLDALHSKVGRRNRAFGVDSLCLIFSISFNKMLDLLQTLVDEHKVTIYSSDRVMNKSKKISIMYVTLL